MNRESDLSLDGIGRIDDKFHPAGVRGKLRCIRAQPPGLIDRHRAVGLRQVDALRTGRMAAIVPDKVVIHSRWSRADQTPAELQIDRAGTRILIALSNLAIGAQRLSSHSNGLGHQAGTSQAQKNSNQACNLADFHFLPFRPEFSHCFPGTSQYSSDHPTLFSFSSRSHFTNPSGRKKPSGHTKAGRFLPSIPQVHF